MRTGVIAKKMGMTRVLSEDGTHIPVTVLQIEDCQVINNRTEDKDGYFAVQVGSGYVKSKNLSKAMRGHFSKSKVEPKKKVVEFRVSKDSLPEVGVSILADHFVIGQKVDVTGVSIGKGFAGVMKRHNFSGLRASHGVSVSHRSGGSTGQCQDPGRVFKGKKMAGQMGNKQITVQNLEVVSTDVERSLILVKGAVPGSKGTELLVKDAVKSVFEGELPNPGSFKLKVISEVESKAVSEDVISEKSVSDKVEDKLQEEKGSE